MATLVRVLFQPYPATTHVHTQVPLAWALRSAGHEVCVATQPDVTDEITRAGLTAIPVGDPLDLEAKMAPNVDDQPDEISDGTWLDVLDISELRPERLTHDYMQGVFTAWTSFVYQTSHPYRMLDELVDFARWWRPDLVIWDTMTFAGPLAAKASGAAHARLLFGLDLVGWMRQHYRAALRDRPPELRDDPLEEWLGRLARRYGQRFSEDLVVGQWTIDPVPPSLRLPVDQHHVSVRYMPYNGRATIPEWLRRPTERRRVCLTLGVSFREVVGGDQASVSDLLEAVADLDVEVVATLNADQLAATPRMPGNVRAVEFVPMDALLPSCSAIIHHSGSGTFLTALAHGVPQVIVPSHMWCNAPRAYRLEKAGAALCHEAGELSLDGLRHSLLQVLEEPSYAASAAEIREEILGTPTPGDIVPALAALADAYRGA